MPGQLVIGWTSPRRTEGAAWCGSQTRALPFPILPILPAPLAPLVATSLALLCAAGPVRRCGNGAKCREILLEDSDHLFCADSGGRLGCGGTFSFLILVAGGQLDVGLHLVVHVDRLGRHYNISWPALRKCMLPHLLPTISRVHLSISSDSRHSLLSSTCPSSHTLHVHTHLPRARLAPGSLSCRLTTRGLEIS